MSLGTLLYTWFFGNFVGSDELSNKYYCNSKNFQDKKAKDGLSFMEKLKHQKYPLIGMLGFINLLSHLQLTTNINMNGKKTTNLMLQVRLMPIIQEIIQLLNLN